MSARKLPIEVLVVACLYILVGTVGLVHHFPWPMVFHQDDVWIELTELLAVIAGLFMLLGRNWARWLAIAWMAFHVALSWPEVSKLAIHALFLAAIAWLLFSRQARQFFANDRNASNAIPG
jgi:hypothetical protein